MHIYIDESGQFRPLGGGGPRAAAVVALVIPSARRTACAKDLRAIKRGLGLRGGEVKGSAVSEEALRDFLTVLRRHDAIAEAVVIDVGDHNAAAITAFQAAQADRVLEHITRDHFPSLIHELIDMGERLRRLPNQLFLQVFCLWQLIPRVIETATMFYSQRLPRELGRFVWRVDAKDRSVTEMEALWTQLIGPIVTTHSEIAPMGMIPGGNYSFYARFDVAPPEGVDDTTDRFFTDMKKVMRNDFRFVPSQDDLGVQAADLVASALTRALNDKLDQRGWELLGPLFVMRRHQTIRFIALGSESEPHSRTVKNDRWASVVAHLNARARPMMTARTEASLRSGGG